MEKQFGYDATLDGLEGNKKVKKFLKEGDSVLVRIPPGECTFYMAHNYFDVHYSVSPFACIKEKDMNANDPFDKAVEYLRTRTKPRLESGQYGKGNEDPEYALQRRLSARKRTLLGFYDIDKGEPFILDLSEKQGKKMISFLKDHQSYFGTHAFEIKKIGKDTETDYSITALLKELTIEQKGHFDACVNGFEPSFYKSALYFRPEDKQVEDLHKIGFDVTAIGYAVPTIQPQMSATPNAIPQAEGNPPAGTPVAPIAQTAPAAHVSDLPDTSNLVDKESVHMPSELDAILENMNGSDSATA